MNVINALLSELDQECTITRSLLERIPPAHFGFKPHQKSTDLIRLGTHIAEIPGWALMICGQDELHFDPTGFTATRAESVPALLEMLGEKQAAARGAISAMPAQKLDDTWTMYIMGNVAVQGPRHQVLRTWLYSHLIHHRGQLSVYLRLLDVPLTSIYGPSADSQ